MLDRRELFRLGLGAGLLSLAPRSLRAWRGGEARTALDDARAAAAWLLRHARTTPNGLAWAVRPDVAPDVVANLYTGNAGIVLFLLELHAATGDSRYRDAALAGARELAASLAPRAGARLDYGLYTGSAGIAFTLGDTHRATGDAQLREAAVAATEGIVRAARREGAGADWGPSIDIISGSAGIGLYLLHAQRTLGMDAALDVAAAAGKRIIALGRPAHGGLKWPPSTAPNATTLYPNFSHGTAGIAYFLTQLHAATGERAFRDAALAGARYLGEVANRAHGGELVFHHEPGGEELYYLSWCHGPSGTARLYRALAQVTGDDAWTERMHASARGALHAGIPETRTPGFWNNISQCCGDAGVGELFLSLHRLQPRDEYRRMADRVVTSLRAQATRDQDGLKWIQAEHRVRPDEVFAQTGLMQGAAGVGLFFARLDAFQHGRTPFVRLPDTPFD